MLISLLQSGLQVWEMVAVLIAYVVVLIFSIGAHEYAHAFIAYRNGDMTAKNMGRMTLNPFKHFDVYGFVCLIVLGFGWANPVPVNPYYFNRGRRSMFQVAMAGIMANLVLALLFTCVYSILETFAYNFLNGAGFLSILIEQLLMIGVTVNLSLAIFNLLPFFPLDGSKILSLILKPGNKVLTFLERYSMLILLALLLFGLISPLINAVVSFLGVGMFAMWSWFFGLFI